MTRLKILKVGAKAGNFTVSRDDFSRIVKSYNPIRHEAPLFVGAGCETCPAVGWVSSLWSAGDDLYAEVRQMDWRVERELGEGNRRIRAVGFYPDYGLRHISLTGEQIPYGLPAFSKKGDQYYEFMQGGDEMALKDDPKMKAFLRVGDEVYFGLKPKEFTEGDNPGEILHRKTMDILMNPPKFDRYGRPSQGGASYVTAFEMACVQNPELTARYIQQLEAAKENNGKPFLFRQEV